MREWAYTKTPFDDSTGIAIYAAKKERIAVYSTSNHLKNYCTKKTDIPDKFRTDSPGTM